jgi:hypothetical protein
VSTPSSITPYPIGIPGTPWGTAEKNAWLACQNVKRSYAAEVVMPLKVHASQDQALPTWQCQQAMAPARVSS